MMQGYRELTGQPCSGKTVYKNNKENYNIANTGIVNFILLKKIFSFFIGVIYLKFKRSKKLFLWSFNENAPFYFQTKIFFNSVSKFGIKYKSNNDLEFIVDEGISHLPFLFLNTDTNLIIEFIRDELKDIEVVYKMAPEKEEVIKRLKNRGHKRLKFISPEIFYELNSDVENSVLESYKEICKKFETI